MDLPFLNPNPSGAASNQAPWETPNQEGSDDATLNELLALYQTGSDPSPFDAAASAPPFSLDPPPGFGQDSAFPPFAGFGESASQEAPAEFPPFAGFGEPSSAETLSFADAPASASTGFPSSEFAGPLMDPFADFVDEIEVPEAPSAEEHPADSEIDALLKNFSDATAGETAPPFSALSDLPPQGDPFATTPSAPVEDVLSKLMPKVDPFANIFDDEKPEVTEPEVLPTTETVPDPFAKIFADEPPEGAEPATAIETVVSIAPSLTLEEVVSPPPARHPCSKSSPTPSPRSLQMRSP